jgi:S-sulfo-L-cysteine synthase (O-acetyl-L-serine-dependent)
LDRIGRTPLLDLRQFVPAGAFELWAKAEFLNPTGSVKDRPAAAIVRGALATGALGHGRTLIDASSGNTAVAYAMLGAKLGFSVMLCVPRNTAPDRLARMRAYGAEIILTDPSDGSDGAQREARRIASAEPNRYYYADQYNNPSNPRAHYEGTGPEIWSQSQGRVTHLVAGVGTGGTISGTAQYLKERRRGLIVVGVEPTGPMHGIEGLKHLPTALRPSTYRAELIDRTIRIETETAAATRDALARSEGLLVGTSAGAAVAASLVVGQESPGSFVVTILPDRRDRDAAEAP